MDDVRMMTNYLKKIKPVKPWQCDIDRFWGYVDIKGPDECWNWIGHKDSHGYGKFGCFGLHFIAHRFIYNLEHPGPICKHVKHTCENPSCVNPKHLYEKI